MNRETQSQVFLNPFYVSDSVFSFVCYLCNLFALMLLSSNQQKQQQNSKRTRIRQTTNLHVLLSFGKFPFNRMNLYIIDFHLPLSSMNFVFRFQILNQVEDEESLCG